ncbi:MAG: ribonuclease D [Coriobacteriia bacterium]|nr:ribonuclease D [Coriobacteriia bacterium]
MYVTDTASLRELVAELRTAQVVAVDTEFMRERTYFARLCLIQLGSESIQAIVDPLACEDLSPLRDLIADPDVVKVFHAGIQDLEIFHNLFGTATAPVFDTQVAATLAGFPQQVGYGALVKELLGVSLDKGDTYTDWSRRPLSDTQVEYALNDVRYLPEIHRRLTETLEREGRVPWLQADFARLENPATYTAVPLEQWRRVKRISSLNRRQLAVAREVAAWREIEAQRRDVPKRWVLGDESIVEIARRSPTTAADVGAVRGVADKAGKSSQRGIAEAVVRALAVPDGELPSLEKRRRPQGDIDAAVDLMVSVVRLRARHHGVAMPLLAARDDLERLAAGEREANPLLEGWRKKMIGDELVRLLDGELCLSLAESALVIEERQRVDQPDS